MHANRCIGKVTNFLTTISCFPQRGAGPYGLTLYTVEIKELVTKGLTYEFSSYKHRNLTKHEALCTFNGTAAENGFKTRIQLEDFNKKVMPA
jgi:hypothetical protein